MDSEIGSDESVSAAVVRAVSAVEGRNPGALPPLTRVLDPDALDLLFDPRADGEARTGGRLSFVYSRCRVTLDNGEFLTIRPLDDDPRASADRDPDRAERR